MAIDLQVSSFACKSAWEDQPIVHAEPVDTRDVTFAGEAGEGEGQLQAFWDFQEAPA